MEKAIIRAIKYFSFFNYAPTADEIYLFLKTRALKRHFTGILEKMAKEGAVLISTCPNEPRRYTVGEYGIKFKVQSSKFKISRLKIARTERYIKILALFPQIKLIGLSGSVAMNNAKEEDDVDLFIITAKNRLFTGRFITLFIAQLFNLRRNRVASYALRVKNKVCLNLFFDEKDMKIPKKKHTEYVAHEVLQMKPLIVKGNIYSQFYYT